MHQAQDAPAGGTVNRDALLVLLPVLDDWQALLLLLRQLDQEVRGSPLPVQVLIVDDGSTTPIPASLAGFAPSAIASISILPLRRNLGHQRAIAIGLAHVAEHVGCRAVLIMDGDGQDSPADALRLVNHLIQVGEDRIVFAARTRRSENMIFRALYHLYRWLHVCLTGISVRVGNFSVVPASLLRRIVVVSELWSHYAAAVFKSRIPYELIPTRRHSRLAGGSRMNLVALVSHGLSALSVHGEVIGTRLLIATSTTILVALAIFASGVGIGFLRPIAIPAWMPFAAGFLLIAILQMLLLSLLAVFVALQSRSAAAFLPSRDYVHFVEPTVSLFPPA